MYSTSSRARSARYALEAARRLRLAEDRLAELVEVQPHARAAPLLEIAAEVFLFAGQDDVLRLVAQPAHDGGDHQARAGSAPWRRPGAARPAPTSPCTGARRSARGGRRAGRRCARGGGSGRPDRRARWSAPCRADRRSCGRASRPGRALPGSAGRAPRGGALRRARRRGGRGVLRSSSRPSRASLFPHPSVRRFRPRRPGLPTGSEGGIPDLSGRSHGLADSDILGLP